MSGPIPCWSAIFLAWSVLCNANDLRAAAERSRTSIVPPRTASRSASISPSILPPAATIRLSDSLGAVCSGRKVLSEVPLTAPMLASVAFAWWPRGDLIAEVILLSASSRRADLGTPMGSGCSK